MFLNWHMLCHILAMNDRDYNECVRLHADNLYRFVFKNIRNAEDAKDIVQSSFEKMWVKRSGVDSNSAKSYLYTVAYHELIDQIRKKRTTVELQDEPYHQRNSHHHKKLLEIALARLTPTQRSLILLKDWEGYSYEEIAEITGLSGLQVKVYLHRARVQVRNFLGSLENVMDEVY